MGAYCPVFEDLFVVPEKIKVADEVEGLGVAGRLKPGVDGEDTAKKSISAAERSERATDKDCFSGVIEEVKKRGEVSFGDFRVSTGGIDTTEFR